MIDIPNIDNEEFLWERELNWYEGDSRVETKLVVESSLARDLVKQLTELDLENRTRASSQFQMEVIIINLKKQIEELEGWKKSALAIIPDLQEIGKLLNLPLGESVHDKIIPAIKSMQQRIQYLELDLVDEKMRNHHDIR